MLCPNASGGAGGAGGQGLVELPQPAPRRRRRQGRRATLAGRHSPLRAATLSGPTIKNSPLRKMHSKSKNGSAKLKFIIILSKH